MIVKSRVAVRCVAHLHFLRIATYYAWAERKCRSILVDGSGKKEETERKKKDYDDEREREPERGVVESGHVTGRRGAKRRTRHRPPPGASPAAPCLSLPVSIFLLSVFVLLLLRVYPRSLWPLALPPSTLANPSARRAFLPSHPASLLLPLWLADILSS